MLRSPWFSVALLSFVALAAIGISVALSPQPGVFVFDARADHFSVVVEPIGQRKDTLRRFENRFRSIVVTPEVRDGIDSLIIQRAGGLRFSGGPAGAVGRLGAVDFTVANARPSVFPASLSRGLILRSANQPAFGGIGLLGPLATLGLAGVLSLTGAALFPARFNRVRRALTLNWSAPLLHFTAGAATLLVLWVSGLLATVVTVGLPLGLLADVAVVTMLAAGLVAAVLLIGGGVRRAARWSRRFGVLEVISGVLVLFIVGLIPIAGWFVVGAASVAGLGAIVVTRFGSPGGWNLAPLDDQG